MDYMIFFVTAFFVNIPFGFYRNPLSEKASSPRLRFLVKLLLIHAPIPLIILLRNMAGIERTLLNLAVSISICILGQMFGSRILTKLLVSRKTTDTPQPVSEKS